MAAIDLNKVKKAPNQPVFVEQEALVEEATPEVVCAGSFKVNFDKQGNVAHVHFYNRNMVTPRRIEEACQVAIAEWQKQGIDSLYADRPNKI